MYSPFLAYSFGVRHPLPATPFAARPIKNLAPCFTSPEKMVNVARIDASTD